MCRVNLQFAVPLSDPAQNRPDFLPPFFSHDDKQEVTLFLT